VAEGGSGSTVSEKRLDRAGALEPQGRPPGSVQSEIVFRRGFDRRHRRDGFRGKQPGPVEFAAIGQTRVKPCQFVSSAKRAGRGDVGTPNGSLVDGHRAELSVELRRDVDGLCPIQRFVASRVRRVVDLVGSQTETGRVHPQGIEHAFLDEPVDVGSGHATNQLPQDVPPDLRVVRGRLSRVEPEVVVPDGRDSLDCGVPVGPQVRTGGQGVRESHPVTEDVPNRGLGLFRSRFGVRWPVLPDSILVGEFALLD